MVRRTAQHPVDPAAGWATQTRVRALLDATAHAVVVFGVAGEVVERNERCADLLGADDERLRLGTEACVDGWHDADGRPLRPHEHPAALARARSGPATSDVCITRPGGSCCPVRASASLVADGSRNVVLTLTDLAQLHAAQLDAKHCRDELRRVAAVASHDLGVPLAVLRRGLAAIDPAQLAGDAAEGLRTARAAADVMGDIVGAVLAYAHVDREVVGDEAVDLGAIAGEVLALLRGHLEQSGAVVRVEALPRVSGSPVLLRQLLQNLVVNAITHHPGPAAHVIVRAEQRDGAPVVVVEDDGDGIPESKVESVFELFARGGSAADGHGIGLSAAKRIVERHGGRIWIEQAVPQGARVCVALPPA
jgi:signal transduction histidine kinase